MSPTSSTSPQVQALLPLLHHATQKYSEQEITENAVPGMLQFAVQQHNKLYQYKQ
jgi:hypothetical protein